MSDHEWWTDLYHSGTVDLRLLNAKLYGIWYQSRDAQERDLEGIIRRYSLWMDLYNDLQDVIVECARLRAAAKAGGERELA